MAISVTPVEGGALQVLWGDPLMRRRTFLVAAAAVALAFMSGSSVADELQWEIIGERTVDFNTDHVDIPVPAIARRYTHLGLRVSGNGLSGVRGFAISEAGLMMDAVLGTLNSADLNMLVGKTYDFDLGGRRAIRRVTVRYQSGGQHQGETVIQLLGRRD